MKTIDFSIEGKEGTNQHRIYRNGKGALPQELGGLWTSEKDANNQIRRYLERINAPKIVKPKPKAKKVVSDVEEL